MIGTPGDETCRAQEAATLSSCAWDKMYHTGITWVSEGYCPSVSHGYWVDINRVGAPRDSEEMTKKRQTPCFTPSNITFWVYVARWIHAIGLEHVIL
jgi:hypothetical protein